MQYLYLSSKLVQLVYICFEDCLVCVVKNKPYIANGLGYNIYIREGVHDRCPQGACGRLSDLLLYKKQTYHIDRQNKQKHANAITRSTSVCFSPPQTPTLLTT